LRDNSADVAQVLSRQGRYQSVRDNLRVKEIRLAQGDGARRVGLCPNAEPAAPPRHQPQQQLAVVPAELERITTLRAKAGPANTTGRGRGRRAAAGDDHLKAECALRDHPALGRWLRQTPGGRLMIDRAKVRAEQRLDRQFLLSTSAPGLSAEDVALGYKNLLEAERCFRDLKTTLELRPVYHHLERRIRAHVLLDWLGLLQGRGGGRG